MEDDAELVDAVAIAHEVAFCFATHEWNVLAPILTVDFLEVLEDRPPGCASMGDVILEVPSVSGQAPGSSLAPPVISAAQVGGPSGVPLFAWLSSLSEGLISLHPPLLPGSSPPGSPVVPTLDPSLVEPPDASIFVSSDTIEEKPSVPQLGWMLHSHTGSQHSTVPDLVV